MEGVEASHDAVDAEALLVPVVGGREEGAGASVGVELGDHPSGGWYASLVAVPACGGTTSRYASPSQRTAKSRSVSGSSWNQRSPSSKRLAGMRPWVSSTFSATGARPRTVPGETATRAVR